MVRKMVPSWQRGFIQRSGRLVLIKSVVTARPVHQLLIMDAPDWVFKEIDAWMRMFLWAGKDKTNGGQCLVAWNTICRLTCFGGLGVKNLKLQALALRVRWEWLRRVDKDRPWSNLALSVDGDATMVFDSLVGIEVGRGDRVLFWKDRWI